MKEKLSKISLFCIIVTLTFSSITMPSVAVSAQWVEETNIEEASKQKNNVNTLEITIDLNEGKYKGSNEDIVHYLDIEEPMIDLNTLPSMDELTNDMQPTAIAVGYVDEFNVPINENTIFTKDTTIFVDWKIPEKSSIDNLEFKDSHNVIASATTKSSVPTPLSLEEKCTISKGQEVVLDPYRLKGAGATSYYWTISDTSIISAINTEDTRVLEFTALKSGTVQVKFYYRGFVGRESILATYTIEVKDSDAPTHAMSLENIEYVEKYVTKQQETVDVAIVEEYKQQGYTNFSWKTNDQDISLVSFDDDTLSATIALGEGFFDETISHHPSVSYQASQETAISGGSIEISTILFKKYYILAYDDLLRPDTPDEVVNGLKPGELSVLKDAQWVSTEDDLIAEISFDIHGVPIATGSDIVIILDNSGSMDEYEIGAVDKYDPFVIAQESVTDFATGLFENNNEQNHRIAFVEFSSELDNAFTFENNLDSFNESFYKATHYNNDRRDIPFGGTNYAVALQRAEFYIEALSFENLEKERPKHIIFISDGKPNDGFEALEEAKRLRDNGVTIHTIGIKLDNEDREALWKITTTPVYRVENIGTELTPVLELIASGIQYAARDTVITDYINDADFEIIDTAEYPLSDNITIDGEEVKIDIGTVTEHTKPASFYVKYIGENNGTLHRTNQEALIEYTDVDGNEILKFSENQRGDPIIDGEERYTGLDSPLLPVPPSGMINIEYYYLDDTGNAFVSEGNDALSTTDMNFAKNVKSIYQDVDGNQILNLNTTHTINGVAPKGYRVASKTIDGVEYTTSNTVTITDTNITPTVIFILEKEPEPTGMINIEYYYLNEAGTEFISEYDETTSTTDITSAKKLQSVYVDNSGSSILPLGTSHTINGVAPEGYRVVDATVNGISYTTSSMVTITEANLTPTVSFVLEKEVIPTGMINIEYYYLNDAGTEFIRANDETTSTTDITSAKKLQSIYVDNSGSSILTLGTSHTINGVAPEGYKVVDATVNGISYTTTSMVTITEANLTPTVSFVLEKEIIPTGMINIEYYYLNDAGTEFIRADNETTSTTDITSAKKLQSIYVDNSGSSILTLGTSHTINGVAPEGYKVVDATVNGISYTTSSMVTITEANLTPTVSFVLEKTTSEPIPEDVIETPSNTAVSTGDTTNIMIYLTAFIVAGCTFGIVLRKKRNKNTQR